LPYRSRMLSHRQQREFWLPAPPKYSDDNREKTLDSNFMILCPSQLLVFFYGVDAALHFSLSSWN
jgi:hypothetical protein